MEKRVVLRTIGVNVLTWPVYGVRDVRLGACVSNAKCVRENEGVNGKSQKRLDISTSLVYRVFGSPTSL